MRKIIVILFILFISKINIAQPVKKFLPDTVRFIFDLTKFMESGDKPKETEILLQEFRKFWSSPILQEKHRQDIYKMSNYMLKKRLRPFPDFSNYLICLIKFGQSDKFNNNWDEWQACLENLIGRSSPNKFNDFVETTIHLIGDTIYKSPTTVWKSTSHDFKIISNPEPIIEFPKLTLKCYANKDSSVIYDTEGKYYFLENKWVGKGGKVTWERAGLSSDSVYAILNNYTIDMKTYKYEADSVKMYYPYFFDQVIIGRLEEKVLAGMNEEKATYPRFESYTKRFKIVNIFENINYEGGFELSGKKFIGKGTPENKAKIEFFRINENTTKLEKFIVAKSIAFIIRTNQITSDRAEITMYLDSDSIYHPGIMLKYQDLNRIVSLLREEKGLRQTPFFDSYHKIDIYCEAIYWKMDEPKVDFAMFKGVQNVSQALFVSADYFKKVLYDRLQGIAEINPLVQLKKYSEKIKSKEIGVDEFAQYISIAPHYVNEVLMELTTQGFLMYDLDNKKVKIKDRLYHWVDANNGKRDYDVIMFNSEVTRDNNASLNLLNYDLTLKGVMQVVVSDSNNVILTPYEQQLQMKKNRDFVFNGRVDAGLFEIYGKDFNFLYDQFKINLNNVDSFTFRVPTDRYDEKGRRIYERIRTMIENVHGDLLIDHPTNKSGLKPYHNYPIFNSKRESYAYYDKPYIYGGVYNRNDFYYQLEPFSFDSLNRFKSEQIRFKGVFVSASIFPDIYEDLTVQPDYSLGFKMHTPEGGLQTYGGKGTYFGEISLSNQGLHGNGKLHYVTSVSKSDDFTFFPDSMNAQVKDFVIKGSTGDPEIPDVVGNDVYTHWLPHEDVMINTDTKEPFVLFNSDVKLHGSTYLSPNGLNAAGTVIFPRAELDSYWMSFKNMEFSADTCNFRMKTFNTEELGFKTENYQAHINMKERKGEFLTNSEEGSLVEFPLNQYVCYMDEFTWYMDKEEIDLKKSEKKKAVVDTTQGVTMRDGSYIAFSGSKFLSIHPAQDSLQFYAPSAKYLTRDNIIIAKDVKIILVADAGLIPDSGKVVIYKKAEMETFKNAKLIANMATKYHEFYNVTANVYGRKNYKASGYLDYIDETKKAQKIFFDNITVDTVQRTYALGEVFLKDNFTLSPYFDYYGKVKLTAANKNMFFDGYARIKHECSIFPINFFKFKSEIDPLEIYIPITDETENERNEKVYAGSLLGIDTLEVYSIFLSKKNKYSDFELFKATGLLYYDKDMKEYRIATYDRIKQNKIIGNYLSLNNMCVLQCEGTFNMSHKLPPFELKAWGTMFHNTKTSIINLDMVLAMDFFFNEKCLEIMTKDLIGDENAKPVKMDRQNYQKSLMQILGIEAADKIINEITMQGFVKKLPEPLIHTIFINDCKMKWQSSTRSFISEDKIGIGNIGKEQINKLFTAYLKIEKKRSGDRLHFYIEDSKKNWYYFNYVNGVVSAISSRSEFNQIISELKPDDRRQKEKGKPEMAYQLSSVKRKSDFLKEMGVE